MNKLINTEVRGPQRRRVEKKKTRKERMGVTSNVRINETQEEKMSRERERERESECRNRERRVKKVKKF